MQTMRWFKWEPGLFPELERWDPGEVGLFLILAQDYWRTSTIPSDSAQCAVQHPTYSDVRWDRVASVIPRLAEYLDGLMDPEKSKKMSDLAKKRWEKTPMRGAMRDAMRSRNAESDTDTDTESESEKEKTKTVRAPRSPKNFPKEEKKKTMNDYYLEIQNLMGGDHAGWTLDRSKNAYWKILNCWEPGRNHSPTQSAELLVRAMRAGANLFDVYHGAQCYRAEHEGDPMRKIEDRTRFMKAPLVWLGSEGWTAYPREEVANG